MAVRVRPDGAVDPNDSADQIPGQGVADLPVSRVHDVFGTWWESANRVADEEARQRAEKWMNEIQGQRLAEHRGLRDRFKIWAEATRKAILGEYDDPTLVPSRHREGLAPDGQTATEGAPQGNRRTRVVLESSVEVRGCGRRAAWSLVACPCPGGPALKPLIFAGEGFSEYFCTQLLGTDPKLRNWLDTDAAEASLQKGFGPCSFGPAITPRS